MFSRITAQCLKPAFAILAALAVGGAWAEVKYITTWTQDFNNSSTYDDQWTGGVYVDEKEGITTTDANSGAGLTTACSSYIDADGADNYCFSGCGNKNSNNRGGYFTFPNDVFGSLTEYIFEFDVYLSGGFYSGAKTNGGGDFDVITLKGRTCDLIVIHMPKAKYVDTAKVYFAKDWNESATYWNDCTPTTTLSENKRDGDFSGSANMAYWHHFVIRATATEGVYVRVTNVGTGAEEYSSTSPISSFETLSKINIIDKQGNDVHKIAFDNFVLKTPAAAGTPDAPSGISIGGESDDIRTVTITASDSAEEGDTISYRVGESGEWTSYTTPFQVTSTCYVYAKSVRGGVDSDIISVYCVAGNVATPTGSITGVSGISRTVTFDSGDYAIQYRTNESDEWADAASKSFTTDSETTYYVRAKKPSSVDGSTTFYSEVLTYVVAAGTAVKLNAPSWRRTGIGTLYASASQSDKPATPTPTIKCQVSGSSDVLSVVGAKGMFSISNLDGATVSLWAECDGYVNSDTTVANIADIASSYATRGSVDYVSIFSTYTGGVTEGGAVTVGDDSSTYHTLSLNGTDLTGDGLVYYTVDGDKNRWYNSQWDGVVRTLYAYNTAKPKTLILPNLEAGWIVNVMANGVSGTSGLTAHADTDSSHSDYYYTVNENGAVTITLTDKYIFALRVYRPAVASVDGQSYATLQDAVNEANGADITLLADTDEAVTLTLAAGQKFIYGEYFCENVTVAEGANGLVLVKDETTKTYTMVDNCTSTWMGADGSDWNTGSNWSTGVVPGQYTAVTINNTESGYQNIQFSAVASCASMSVSGNIEFSQTNKGTGTAGSLSTYGDITVPDGSTATIKLNRTGIDNATETNINVYPDLIIVDRGSDYDSWIGAYGSARPMTMKGAITVEKKFIVWGGPTKVFEGDITFNAGSHMGSWSDTGYKFNDIVITALGDGVSIWTGNAGLNSPITGSGVTFAGVISIDTTGGTTISAPVILMDGASISVATGGSLSGGITCASANHAYKTETANNITTYTDVDNSASTWDPAGDGKWSTASNWSTGVEPGAATAVTFPSTGAQYTVNAYDGATCGNVTVSGDVVWHYDVQTWATIEVSGDIGGTGSLTLDNNVGIRCHKAGTFTISSKLCFAGSTKHNWISTGNEATGYSDNVLLSGEEITIKGVYEPNLSTTFSGPVYVTANSQIENSNNSPVAFNNTLRLSANLQVPEGLVTFASGQPSTTVEGKKVSSSTTDGTTYYWLDDAAIVSVSSVSATYGVDFTNATVTATLTGATTAGQSYTMTVGGKSYNGEATTDGKVTFNDVAVTYSSVTDKLTYEITSNDASVSGGSGSKDIADVADWFSTSASETKGGSWNVSPWANENGGVVTSDNSFTPVASDASVVDVTVKVCFGDANDDAIELADAKAAVKIATVKVNDVDTLVFQALNNGTFVTLTGGDAPNAEMTYNVALHLDYAARKYTVNIDGTQMTYNESQWLAMPNDATAMTAVAFQGRGTLTSLVGETSEGYVAMDAAGNRYVSLDAARTAGIADSTKLPLTVLHEGTLNNETYAKSSQVLPTGVNNVKITAASLDAANAAAAKMEIALTSAQVNQGLKKDYYKAVATKSGEGDTYTLSIELDETEVAPTVADGTDKAMETTETGVSFNVVDAKVGLYYGIAAGGTPEQTTVSGTMTKCTEDGSLKLSISDLPANGVRYYKVIVDDKGN